MTGTRTPSRPAPPIRRPVVLGVLALAAVAAAVGIGVGSITRGSAFVERITVDNPTLYNLQVDIGAPGEGQVLAVGTVPREGSRQFHQVVDQGERWVFRLSFGVEEVGEIEVPRPQLEQDGWKVAVPPDGGRRLADAGHPPRRSRSSILKRSWISAGARDAGHGDHDENAVRTGMMRDARDHRRFAHTLRVRTCRRAGRSTRDAVGSGLGGDEVAVEDVAIDMS